MVLPCHVFDFTYCLNLDGNFLLFYIFLLQYVIVPLICAVHLVMDAFYLREKLLFYFGFYRLWKWIRKENILEFSYGILGFTAICIIRSPSVTRTLGGMATVLRFASWVSMVA